MNAAVYRLIILLMGISAVGMIGLQGGFLYKQYRQRLENFDFNVQRAADQTLRIYAQWNSHTSSPEDAASFNALYANADSSFSARARFDLVRPIARVLPAPKRSEMRRF